MKENCKNSNPDHNLNSLIIGAITGSLIGAGAIMFFDQKEAKNLRRNFRNVYGNITDKAGELKENIVHQGEELIERAQKLSLKTMKNTSNNQLIVAGLALGILGGTVTYMLASRSCRESDDETQFIPKDFEKKAEPWLKNAKVILNTICETLEEKGTRTIDGIETKVHEAQHSHTVEDFLDLANAGIRLYQKMKHRH